MSDHLRASERGYPLGALFLLTAACAVMLGLIGLLVREPREFGGLGREVLVVSLIASGVCLILGVIVGLFHFARLRGAAWGALVGWLLGLLWGPILYIPAQAFPRVLLTSVVGAILLVGTAATFRLLGRRAVPPIDESSPTRPANVPKPHPLDAD